MHFVLLGTHTPDTCPTSNSKIRDMMLQGAKDMPALAQRLGVTMVAGPFVNHEHTMVSIVRASA